MKIIQLNLKKKSKKKKKNKKIDTWIWRKIASGLQQNLLAAAKKESNPSKAAIFIALFLIGDDSNS